MLQSRNYVYPRWVCLTHSSSSSDVSSLPGLIDILLYTTNTPQCIAIMQSEENKINTLAGTQRLSKTARCELSSLQYLDFKLVYIDQFSVIPDARKAL